jgi:hypothetical protein
LILKEINTTLKRYVSCRFLSSFFPEEIRGVPDYKINGMLRNLSTLHNQLKNSPYQILDKGIVLNDVWIEYFTTHQYLLRSFIKWHLLKFLQKNNPNVIGLSEKIEKPILRDLKAARMYWDGYLAINAANCIYSGVMLDKKEISLDHFIPWSYVAHDEIWNIIPTVKSVNSSKSDLLPSMEKYSEPFCRLQFNAFNFHALMDQQTCLDDFYSILGTGDLKSIKYESFRNTLLSEIETNIRTAKNLGFGYPFEYRLKEL